MNLQQIGCWITVRCIIGRFEGQSSYHSHPHGRADGETGVGDVKVQILSVCIVNGVGHAFRTRAVARCGDNGVARLCYIA